MDNHTETRKLRKPTSLALKEHRAREFFHQAEYGEMPEDLMQPEYWAHVTRMLTPGSKIEALAADGTWWVSLLVRAVGRTEALVHPLQVVTFQTDAEVVDEPEFKIMWRGPARKFGIIRISDNSVIKDEFATKDAASLYLKNYVKRMAA